MCVPVCAENNVSVSQNITVVNYWEISLNSDDSGAELELLVLRQNFARSVMAFDSPGLSRERLLT